MKKRKQNDKENNRSNNPSNRSAISIAGIIYSIALLIIIFGMVVFSELSSTIGYQTTSIFNQSYSLLSAAYLVLLKFTFDRNNLK